MSRNLTNAVYGVLDYASYPFGMLLAAPIILHKLGASEYGLWMIATAVVSAGGIIASGFCDANIQRVAVSPTPWCKPFAP
jgi:O-antigen/teichoic acid export membrane protein